MFENNALKLQLATESTIHSQSQVIAEWNLNTFDNIKTLGNYRFRPADPTSPFYTLTNSFSEENESTVNPKYYGATDSDIVVDGTYDDQGVPQVFLSQNKKMNMLYSLESCFYKFRPRSGINKSIFLAGNKKINVFNKDMFRRPRYYMSSPSDKFKYWTSYRKEANNSGQISATVYSIKFNKSGSGSTPNGAATITTTATHGFNIGDIVRISNPVTNPIDFLPAEIVVTAKDSTTFTGYFGPALTSDYLTSTTDPNLFTTGQTVSGVVAVKTKMPNEYGISVSQSGTNYISDAVPFVVYENQIPTNRIIVKMQTNIGTVNLGNFRNNSGTYPDPFYGDALKTVPDDWKIQYLNSSNTWVDVINLDQSSVGADGYLELSYGLIVPSEYRDGGPDDFIYAGEVSSLSALPEKAPLGYSYLYKPNSDVRGTFYIWTNSSTTISGVPLGYSSFDPSYGWQVEGNEPTRFTNYVTKLVDADKFIDGSEIYREFQYIKGLRVVATSMNVTDCTLDLIELSPRLTVDLSDKTESLDVSKGSSSMPDNGIPVDGILVSQGSITLFDYDNAFSEYNDSSILNIKNNSNKVIYNVGSRNLQVKIYDVIYDDAGISYHIPIKTLYGDGFPESDSKNRSVSINLRDMFSYFESITATEVLYSKASLSFIVASLLDSVGFSNYIFKRVEGEKDPIIPYFFVQPNATISQILESLAISTQTAIFFDEYNNLVLMSKEYLLPEAGKRNVDYTFFGSADSQKDGIVKNQRLVPTVFNITGVVPDGVHVSYTVSEFTEALSPGSIIQISGLSPAGYNGTFVISNSSNVAKTFTVANTTSATVTDSNGSATTKPLLANIEEISGKKNEIFNNGKITYSVRNILKEYANIDQAYLTDSGKTWKYKNALLWEIAPEQNLKPTNEDDSSSGGYTLSAIPIKSNLSSDIPTVTKGSITSAVYTKATKQLVITSPAVGDISGSNTLDLYNLSDERFNAQTLRIISYNSTTVTLDASTISDKFSSLVPASLSISNQAGYFTGFKNRVIDFGESIMNMTRYNGYFYANSEIIKYDAIEFAVSGIGLVWISSQTEYKNYFSKLPFNGSIIPTGNVRIYTEPKYKDGQIIAGDVARHGRGQFGTKIVSHKAGVSDEWLNSQNQQVCNMTASYIFNMATTVPTTVKTGKAGVLANSSDITKFKSVNRGVIKNIFAAKYPKETDYINNNVPNGSLQASALIMSGAAFSDSKAKPINYISYTYKTLDDYYNYFGTRLRILGTPASGDNDTQTPIGSTAYVTTTATSSTKNATGSKASTPVVATGSSGGLAVLVDPITNLGYYFEVVALTDSSLLSYSNTSTKINNLFFYKIEKNKDTKKTQAVPISLWSGRAQINVDDGNFTGQYMKTGEELPTVYDISVEYKVNANSIDFYLYFNNKLIGKVTDKSPLTNRKNTVGLFTRGKSKLMFENVFGLKKNSTSNSPDQLAVTENIFNFGDANYNGSTSKYALSEMISKTYLAGIGTETPPKYDLFFEEFGTIMREVSYMNIKYDKAYPALYAKLMPTFSSVPTYATAGFIADPYGAKFLIFNVTDSNLLLDLEQGSSYVRISGVTFTSQSNNQLTVDEYFKKHSDISDPEFDSTGGIANKKAAADYANLKNSRLMYGSKEINLDATYIQSQDAADEMMGWLISKIMSPRKSIGIKTFFNPMLQLGDVVTIDYEKDGQAVVAEKTDRFVIYFIEYTRDVNGPEMNVYLSEVI
jgi:hypothetical protein